MRLAIREAPRLLHAMRPFRSRCGAVGSGHDPVAAPPMSLFLIRITCPDRETAGRMAAALVAERLAACAHVGEEIESTYWWNGAVETARETPLLLKTRATLFGAAAARVRDLHPYEVPAIVGHPIEAVDDYAAWVAAETLER